MRVYDIPAKFEQMMDTAFDEEGVLDESRIQDFQIEVEESILNALKYAEGLRQENKAIQEAINRMQKRKKSNENYADRIESMAIRGMRSIGARKLQDPEMKVVMSTQNRVKWDSEISPQFLENLAVKMPEAVRMKTNLELNRQEMNKRIKENGWEIPEALRHIATIVQSDELKIK